MTESLSDSVPVPTPADEVLAPAVEATVATVTGFWICDVERRDIRKV